MIRVSDEAGLAPRPRHPVQQSIRSRSAELMVGTLMDQFDNNNVLIRFNGI